MKLHDSTPDFIAFYEATRARPDAEKLKRFWSELHPVSPAFYDLRLSNWEKAGEDAQAKLLEEFSEFGTYEEEFVRRQALVPKQLEATVTSFREHFPDFSPDFDVYLLHSLKRMNGGTRKLGGEHTFIFGLDMMARYHTWQDETPFFHHELLHFYMKQLHAASDWYDADTLLLNLWEEGLAVYVSRLLNPDASYTELSLNVPGGLVERAWQKRDFLANDLGSKPLFTDEDVYDSYFTGWSVEGAVPGRAGYFIGFLVINELAKRCPLEALLKPSGKTELLEMIRAQLAELATLPDDAYLPTPPDVT